MEETEQRLAAARAKRATAQALIDAQKQLVDQADKEERALKEQLDAERTSAYEGKFVRGQSINGTVRAVKYGEAYISWADGVDYAIKFEHLDMCLERYEDWAAGVLQEWDCAPSGACLDGLEAPPPLVEAEPAADAAPALPSPRSVVATPAVAPLVAAAPVLPLIEEAPKPLVTAKPLVTERVVAAMADDDDVPVEAVVDDVAAATGGHKAAGEILPTRQAQPVAKPGGADAEQGVDAHGVEAQGADAEMEGADAEERGGEEEPLDADGVEAATGGVEGDVVVEEGTEEGGGVEEGAAEGVAMEGVEATGGGADGKEGAVEAMEEGDDDTISIMETGVGVAGATGAVEEEGGLEAHGVEDGVATGIADGDGDRMLGVPSNAVDTVSTVGISVEIKSISRRPVARDLLVDLHRSSRRRRTSRGATGSSPFTARARSTAGPSPSYQRFAGGRGPSRRSRGPRRAVSSAACCTTTSCSRRTSRGASFGVSWPRPTPVRVLPLRMLPRHCRGMHPGIWWKRPPPYSRRRPPSHRRNKRERRRRGRPSRRRRRKRRRRRRRSQHRRSWSKLPTRPSSPTTRTTSPRKWSSRCGTRRAATSARGSSC